MGLERFISYLLITDRVGVEWYMGAFRRVREELPDMHIRL